MNGLRRLAVLALLPTAVDVGLLVVFRQALGWPLIVADLGGIAVASVVSYSLHRVATYRSDPYVRWVRHPGAFAVLAGVAGVIDAIVLRLTFVAAGYTSVGGLLLAKAVSLSVAVAVRAVGYRYVLSDVIVEGRRRVDRPPPTGDVRYSVVVPAFREPERIGATVRRIRDELADVADDGGLEIVVVDDGSGDATADVAVAAGADQVVVLPVNRGKGGALRAGVAATRGRVVAFTDADLAYDAPHLRRLLDEVEAGWDVVIGNRRHPDSVVRDASGLRAIGSRVVNRLAAAVLLARPADTQCGLKGFRGDVARDLFARGRIDGFAFDIELLHLVERDECSLIDIPVRIDEDPGGSTVRVLLDTARLVRDLAKVRYWSSSGRYERSSSLVG